MSTTHAPRPVEQVMVSSTFVDLETHREALLRVLNRHGLHPNVMEYGSALSIDVVESSLRMVRDSAAYIGLVSHRYGQIPVCAVRNPDGKSITELEFDEAQRLARPILLFIMGEEHDVKRNQIENDPKKQKKLDAFRARAKRIATDSAVERVYAVFESLEDFKEKIGPAVAKLADEIERRHESVGSQESPTADIERSTPATTSLTKPVPRPPTLYAAPDYIGSHPFVGRRSQLDELDDWARAADPTNLLLFEAIGGNGKSMLTWEWVTTRATDVRTDWAGRFWYSFYERGAIMADFCRHALAYMTGRPLEEFRRKKTAELREPLMAQLHARPWLLILDGLERVLVAYHRIDAAELADEAANAPTDAISNRDPCDAIREEDGELLRSLAGAAPSKILVSTRLTPRALLNPAGQAIVGAKRVPLPGLRPADAEAMFRNCGIAGDGERIRAYLSENCDNHPLVIGALAGLIAHYLPARGDFDAWLIDPDGGAALDLAALDLVQRRNHILHAAIRDLDADSAAVLSMLSMLSEAVDYDTLKALNPMLPPEPERVEPPESFETTMLWKSMDETKRTNIRARQRRQEADHRAWLEAMSVWQASPALRDAPQKLHVAVRDLERRGLLQYDHGSRRYDLHPVVRSVASGWLSIEERERHGGRVIDHFSSRPHRPYDEAETLEDIAPALQVVRTSLKIGRLEQAMSLYLNDLDYVLDFNLEAYAEGIAILRQFFARGWSTRPANFASINMAELTNRAGIMLANCGDHKNAEAAYHLALNLYFYEQKQCDLSSAIINNIGELYGSMNRLSVALRMQKLSEEIRELLLLHQEHFASNLVMMMLYAQMGDWRKCEEKVGQVKSSVVPTDRGLYRQGDKEVCFAICAFYKGEDPEKLIETALQAVEQGRNRFKKRLLHRLRGMWNTRRGDWRSAIASYREALRMARERGLVDAGSEAGLAYAKYMRRELLDPRHEAERLAEFHEPNHDTLARLWQAMGHPDRARHHAREAYRWAWADGEPFVHRYWLDQAIDLLHELGEPIPDLPPYDPAQDPAFPWEADVRAEIERLRAERAAELPDDDLG